MLVDAGNCSHNILFAISFVVLSYSGEKKMFGTFLGRFLVYIVHIYSILYYSYHCNLH